MRIKTILLIIIVCLLISLSGCVNADVYQKIKRNGHYDLEITLSTSPEYQTILNGMKQVFIVDESAKDKFVYHETENSIIYVFKDIDPKIDKKLFKDTSTSEQNQLLGGSATSPNISIFNPTNLNLKTEFKFPYYEYTYTFTVPSTNQKEKPKQTLKANEYIIDEAKLLNDDQKQSLINTINYIYQNDTVELIIVTKPNMTYSEYTQFQTHFINTFPFKETKKHFVQIFVSTGNEQLCAVNTNLFLESNIYSQISTIDSEFSKACRIDYSNQITSTKDKIEQLFWQNDLIESKDLENSLGSLYKIGYTVEAFGEITNTNGLKMEDNVVKFDVDVVKGGAYTLTIQDFFLAAIFGDRWPLYITLIISLIVISIGVIIAVKILKKKPITRARGETINLSPELTRYVQRARSTGMTEQEIRESLEQNGWAHKEIELALKRGY